MTIDHRTLFGLAFLSLGLAACSGSSDDASSTDDSALSKNHGEIGNVATAQGADETACRNNLVRQAGYVCRATGIESVTSNVSCGDSEHHTACTCTGNIVCKPGASGTSSGQPSSGAQSGGAPSGGGSGGGGSGGGGTTSSSGAPPAPTAAAPQCSTSTATMPAGPGNSTCGTAGGTVTVTETTCWTNGIPATTQKTSQVCNQCTTSESCQPINGNQPGCAAGSTQWCTKTTSCTNGTTSSGLPYCK